MPPSCFPVSLVSISDLKMLFLPYGKYSVNSGGKVIFAENILYESGGSNVTEF